MADKCDAEVFKHGNTICTLGACMHRAELFAQAVARESGQRVDWHYTGGVANVLYVGDHAAVAAAVRKLEPMLGEPLARKPGECGSCSGATHRAGYVRGHYGPDAHGPYRAGDELPPGVIAVVTT